MEEAERSTITLNAAQIAVLDWIKGGRQNVTRGGAARQCQWLLGPCSPPASRFPFRGKR